LVERFELRIASLCRMWMRFSDPANPALALLLAGDLLALDVLRQLVRILLFLLMLRALIDRGQKRRTP